MTHPTIHHPAEDSVRSVRGRDKARNWLDGLVENFTMRGGQIQQIETGVSGETKSDTIDVEKLAARIKGMSNPNMKLIAKEFGTSEHHVNFLMAKWHKDNSARKGAKSTHRRTKYVAP